jgi:hypothetical protein
MDMLQQNVNDIFGAEREEMDEARAKEQARVLRLFRNVANTRDGMELLWWLLEEGHIFTTTFTGNELGAFMEGERNMALKVLRNLLSVKPRAFAEFVEARLIEEKDNG